MCVYECVCVCVCVRVCVCMYVLYTLVLCTYCMSVYIMTFKYSIADLFIVTMLYENVSEYDHAIHWSVSALTYMVKSLKLMIIVICIIIIMITFIYLCGGGAESGRD